MFMFLLDILVIYLIKKINSSAAPDVAIKYDKEMKEIDVCVVN